jgi:hypothetical protein
MSETMDKAWYTNAEVRELLVEQAETQQDTVREACAAAVRAERARIVKIVEAEQRRSECIRRINSGE